MLSGAPTIPAGDSANLACKTACSAVRLGARIHWRALAIPLVWISAVSTLLATIVLVSPVPPLVESDYAYLLTAADRFADGNGLMTTPPLAPHQIWEWQSDWTFLTKWPVGYPVIVAALRSVFGVSSLDACRWISILACAAALVGWFKWTVQLIPSGVTRYLVAGAGAGLSLPVAWLVNPSTDVIVVAVLPWIMMSLVRVVSDVRDAASAEYGRLGNNRAWHPTTRFALIGVSAGSLFWIRYASIFVPLAIGLYALYEWTTRRGVRFRHVLLLAIGGALPIAVLLMMNAGLGAGESMRSQLNLGDRVGFEFSPALLGQAWWMFTDLGYYAHRTVAHWTLAFWPIVLAAGVIAIHTAREAAKQLAKNPAVALSVALVVSLLAMLVAAKVLFAGKFDYVGLDRYYQPIRPLYLVLFVAPVVMRCGRWVRGITCLALMLACLWTVGQSWIRNYTQWSDAPRPTTPSGSWSRCFEPGAGELYRWLGSQSGHGLVVASNFHEFAAFETQIPAIPVPPDRRSLDAWLARIREARNTDGTRVIFALDPSNRWRDYWLDSPAEVIERLGLIPVPGTPTAIAPYLFELPAAGPVR